ncbi:MAG: helix-turn-helix domain-containing protein, partial [Paracoccaceae bacterium]
VLSGGGGAAVADRPLLARVRNGINDIMPTFSANTPVLRRTVGFILFDRVKLIDVTGPLQVFNDARLTDGTPAYAGLLISQAGGRVMTDAGITLDTVSFAAAARRGIDTLLVAGGDAALEAAGDAALQRFLGRMRGKCRRFGSVCLGAFVLAAGGHLDGRRATTHWEQCAEFAARFPEVGLDPDSIYRRDGAIWTSAGVSAGIDMALAMVEEDLGRDEAMRLAQVLVLFLRRPGGQKQFSAALERQSASAGGRFDALVGWIAAHPGADLSVAALAARAGMSERNFARVFTAETGRSPAKFVEAVRVEAACAALERPGATLARVVRDLGFGNDERLRRAFHRLKGCSPSEYLVRFGGGWQG